MGFLRKSSQVAEPPLASLALDFWELRSGEAAAAAHPDTFDLPPRTERESLVRGQTVKLIFDQEGCEEDGSVTLQGERMWVIVSERIGSRYIGMLTSKPQLLEPGEETYLRAAAEVCFGAEHVIAIDQPPSDFVRLMFSEPPTRTWPRTAR